METYRDYRRFIEENFQIVNKELKLIDFKLNSIQIQYLEKDALFRDIVLKARQFGFSSLIDAVFTVDFIVQENSYSVIVADSDENAEILLARVKLFIDSYNGRNKVKVPLKYETKNLLYNPFINSRFSIGTAKNTEFGRSRTISNLHCSEVAFFPDIQNIVAGAGQAVVETGKEIYETTANGFNEFKDFYFSAKNGENGYTALFYKASDFYTPEFLAQKRKQLGRLYPQEYPETDIECFLASGDCYFDTDMLEIYYRACKPAIQTETVY